MHPLATRRKNTTAQMQEPALQTLLTVHDVECLAAWYAQVALLVSLPPDHGPSKVISFHCHCSKAGSFVSVYGPRHGRAGEALPAWVTGGRGGQGPVACTGVLGQHTTRGAAACLEPGTTLQQDDRDLKCAASSPPCCTYHCYSPRSTSVQRLETHKKLRHRSASHQQLTVAHHGLEKHGLLCYGWTQKRGSRQPRQPPSNPAAPASSPPGG
jgi:hypothetical protein